MWLKVDLWPTWWCIAVKVKNERWLEIWIFSIFCPRFAFRSSWKANVRCRANVSLQISAAVDFHTWTIRSPAMKIAVIRSATMPSPSLFSWQVNCPTTRVGALEYLRYLCQRLWTYWFYFVRWIAVFSPRFLHGMTDFYNHSPVPTYVRLYHGMLWWLCLRRVQNCWLFQKVAVIYSPSTMWKAGRKCAGGASVIDFMVDSLVQSLRWILS